jgi:rhodanese-related sulfurtransferase
MRKIIRRLFLSGLWLMCATLQAQALVEPDKVPQAKRTPHQLYVLAKDVPELLQKEGSVLFLDVRTRAEAMFVGMTGLVDGLVPYMELQDFMADWDDKRQSYVLEPNADFLREVTRRLEDKRLSKSDAVIVMCRSGDRSGRAATHLAELGFAKVYSVVDGFEGDLSASGRRDVNGWKNAGLPWSYKLQRHLVYFTH